jgi:uncharacterized RDD family membrane protein YckC
MCYRATPERNQIATELRGLIAERLAHGQSLDEVLRQLGDPLTLAESYLAAVPLVSAPFGRRAVAKIIDLLLVIVPVVTSAGVAIFLSPREAAPVLLFVAIFGSSVVAGLYLFLAEAKWGYTVGKHLLGLRVVRESGARITTEQAIVRQLPMFLQMYWIDILFALFTEKSQRAFELLSKTRVVVADRGAARHP